MYANQQQQLLKQQKAFQQRTKQEQVLSSPWLLFAKEPRASNARFIYWFAYSAGTAKNIAWGFYDMQERTLKIKGACNYRKQLKVLNAALRERKIQDYKLIASAAEDHISPRLAQQLPEAFKGVQLSHNRLDMTRERFSADMRAAAKAFFEAIQFSPLASATYKVACDASCLAAQTAPLGQVATAKSSNCAKDDACKFMRYGTDGCRSKKSNVRANAIVAGRNPAFDEFDEFEDDLL